MDGRARTKSKLHPLIEQILVKRGLLTTEQQEEFLSPDYSANLHDPFLMTDMKTAVDRIILAIKGHEDIVIYGDYDIDGITASAVMIEGLTAMGARVRSYIPDRFEEGYGINQAALASLKESGASLVISVDCGITSVAEVAWARDNGLDVVITDHHSVPEEIPQAIAVINPKRPGDPYPFKDLAGVGVAFKLVQALQQTLNLPQAGQEKWLLDLVALGTVCDVVTLIGENRVLVSFGLKVMQKSRRPGIKSLSMVGGVELGDIKSYHLGFVFGPRMNAAGRLEHAARSLELMLTTDFKKAFEIAEELNALNEERRAHQAEIVAQASAVAEKMDDPVLVLASPEWSHGIVGIAASKLVEQWQRPVLVMQIMGDNAKGSARSLGAFNIVEAFRAMPQHFIKFGGHHFAAGYTIPVCEISALQKSLNEYALAHPDKLLLGPGKEFDAEVQDFSEMDWELLESLDRLEPFGNANLQPSFCTIATISAVRKIGKDASHYKFELTDSRGMSMSAIGFGLVRKFPELKSGEKIKALFTLTHNHFNGRSSLQLNILSLL